MAIVHALGDTAHRQRDFTNVYYNYEENAYYNYSQGIIAFRDLDNKLWVLDRTE